MDAGSLVSDDVMIGIVRERLDAARCARAGSSSTDFRGRSSRPTALDGMVDGRGAAGRASTSWCPEDVLRAAAGGAADLQQVRRERRRRVDRRLRRPAAARWCSGSTTASRSCASG